MNKLILHKINHKPLLIEKIFPYTINRPLIFQILLKEDLSLKKSLKIAFKTLKKTNDLNGETNETFYRFISYRLIFEKNLYEEYLINLDYILNTFKNSFYFNFFQRYFFKVIGNNMDIKYKIIKDEALNNFILDYSQYHKKFCLYIYLDIKQNLELLKKLKLKYIEYDIDLIFFIDDKLLGIDDNIKSELINQNFKVKNIYFAFVEGNKSENEINFQQIKEYIDIINKMKNKNNIKNISLKYLGRKGNIFINYLYENNLYINLENLEKVEYNENKYLTLYEKFILRCKLNLIFNKKYFFNLIIITPEDFNNIKEINEEKKKYLINKLNFFEQNNNNTDLKFMLLDFQNNSPYQENFIYFCEKYLSNINGVNTVLIFNVGTTNEKIECKKYIKKPLINFYLLKNIIYENKIGINKGEIGNEIKEFIDLFFCTDNLLYKIYTQHFLFYSNELKIFDIIDKKNIIVPFEIKSLKIYFDNIIYEIYDKKELNIKQCENKDFNFLNIKKTLKYLKKNFNLDLKGEVDIINKINSYNIDSNILTDKIQYDIVIKELGTLRTIFKSKKIFEGEPGFKKISRKLFNKKNVYRLAIFNTIESDIFGFCFKLNYKKNESNFSFLFTSNTEILNNVWDDDIFIKDGPLFIKEYITENELFMIKNYVIAKKKFVDDIINYSEIYYLKIFL